MPRLLGDFATLTLCKGILYLLGGVWGLVSTITLAVNIILSIEVNLVNTMIFDTSIADWVIWVVMILSIVGITIIDYKLTYTNCKKQKIKKGEEVPDKFDFHYIVAGVASVIVATVASYLVMFFGLDYVWTYAPIKEVGLAVFITMGISMIIAYIVDAVLFHRIANGMLDDAWIAGQETIREQTAEKDFQDSLVSLLAEKGILKSEQIEFIKSQITSLDDPKLEEYVKMFMPSQEGVVG